LYNFWSGKIFSYQFNSLQRGIGTSLKILTYLSESFLSLSKHVLFLQLLEPELVFPIPMRFETGNLNNEQQLVVEVKKATTLRLPEQYSVSTVVDFKILSCTTPFPSFKIKFPVSQGHFFLGHPLTFMYLEEEMCSLSLHSATK
jgi:hypothetical protein